MSGTVGCYLCDHTEESETNSHYFGYGPAVERMREHYHQKHNPEKQLYCVRCIGNSQRFSAPSLEHMRKKHKSEIAGFWGLKKSTLVNGKSATRYVCRMCKEEQKPLTMFTSDELVVHLWNDHENQPLNKIRDPTEKEVGGEFVPVQEYGGDWDTMMRPYYSMKYIDPIQAINDAIGIPREPKEKSYIKP